MVEYHVIWSPPAENDLARIYDYFAEQALIPAVGARLVEKIRREGDDLAYSPYCPVYNKKRKLRRKIVGVYQIFFTLDEEKRVVWIKQVVHGKRNLKKVLR
jgi:plasmid stabilization system protein ParE